MYVAVAAKVTLYTFCRINRPLRQTPIGGLSGNAAISMRTDLIPEL